MFKSGLPKKIQEFLLIKQPSDYYEMILSIRQFIGANAVLFVGNEEGEKKEHSKKNEKYQRQKNSESKSMYCSICKTQTHNTRDCRYKKNNNQIKTEKNTQSPTVVCFACGEEGHIKPNCPRKTGGYNRQSNQAASSNNVTQASFPPCDTCKKTNHKSENCFFKLINAVQKSQNLTAMNKKQDELMNIAINDNQDKIAFLPDTGAARTMIPYKDFKRLKLSYSTRSTPNLTHAGNNALELLGMTDLTLHLGDRRLYVSAAVAEDAVPFGLLGRDVLEEYGLFAGKIGGRWMLTDTITTSSYKTEQVAYQCLQLDHELEEPTTKKTYGSKPRDDEIYHHRPVPTTETFFSRGCTQPKNTDENNGDGLCIDFITEGEDQRGLDKPVAVKFAKETTKMFDKQWLEKMTTIASKATGVLDNEPTKIEIKGEIIKQRPYGGSRRKEELIKSEVNKLIDKGFVEKSSASGCAPVLLVKKPKIDPQDEKEVQRYRMVEDYRQLNEITVKNAGTLPNIDKLFDKIQGKAYYVLIDLVDAFYHQRITEDSKPKTAFVTETGLYQFKRLLQGWTNSPQIFQDKIEEVLEEGKKKKRISENTWNFVDDIIGAGDDLKTLKEETEALIEWLVEKGLMINIPKSSFGVTECRYLGYELSSRGRALNAQIITKIEDKLRVLLTGPEINSQETEVIKNQAQKIVGLINFYRKFIRKTSEKTQILTEKIKNPTPFTAKQKKKIENLFEELNDKKYITSIKPNVPLRIYTDASDKSAGYVAIQGKSVVDLDSARFQSEAIQQSPLDRELAAIRLAIKKLAKRHDLYGSTIYTDHKPIIYMLNGKLEPEHGRRSRIILEIRKAEVNVVYVKGKENAYADALSRMNTQEKIKKDWSVRSSINVTIEESKRKDDIIKENQNPKPKKERNPDIMRKYEGITEEEWDATAKESPPPKITKPSYRKIRTNFLLSTGMRTPGFVAIVLCLMAYISTTAALPEKINPWYCPQSKNNMQQISMGKKEIKADVYRINKPFQKTMCWDYLMRYIVPGMTSFRVNWKWELTGDSLSKIVNFQQMHELKPRDMYVRYMRKPPGWKNHMLIQKVKLNAQPHDYKNMMLVDINEKKERRPSFFVELTETDCYTNGKRIYDQWKSPITNDEELGGEHRQIFSRVMNTGGFVITLLDHLVHAVKFFMTCLISLLKVQRW